MARLIYYGATTGRPVEVIDAWRSRQAQQDAYDRWRVGLYDVPIVAKPGTSKHETGEAFDLEGKVEDLKALGRVWMDWGGKWGGVWRHAEVWHFEYANDMKTPEYV